MFPDDVVDRIVNDNVVNEEVFTKLLDIYVYPNAEWWQHVGKFLSRAESSFGKERGRELTRQALAFTILIPTKEKGFRIDEDAPQRLLFGSGKFDNFKERDWFGDLKKVLVRDQEIARMRKEILDLGFIDPIDYQPYSRQAFKWLCERSEEQGALNTEVKDKFRKLVMVYGGWVISYLFTKHEKSLESVHNWRTGYFVEHVIHDVYSLDQIKKIKGAELDRTNEKWVRRLKVSTP